MDDEPSGGVTKSIHLLLAAIVSLVGGAVLGCSSSTVGPPSAKPTVTPSSPSSEPTVTRASPRPESAAEAVFQDTSTFRFKDLPHRRYVDFRARFMKGFGRMRPLAFAVKRVTTAYGGFTGVHALAISYTIPPGVPFEAVAREIGDDFLGATPRNSESVFGGAGIRLVGESGSESFAFFAGEETFVYVHGVNAATPADPVARALYEATRGWST